MHQNTLPVSAPSHTPLQDHGLPDHIG
jgi:hypothetical protein